MKRAKIFGGRCLKEMLRDPLSYIFCLGFPLIMMVIMTIIDQSIPEGKGPDIFHIGNLTAGIIVFGLTFTMLFTSINVAHDRGGSFLVRMYATPMKSTDFILGYIIPSFIIAVAQTVVSIVSAVIVSLITDGDIGISVLAGFIPIIPSALMFIGFGLIAGTLLSEKGAPGICSVFISLAGMLGGIWFDPESTGGVMLTVSKCMPFYYCTKSTRAAIAGDFSFDAFLLPLIVITVCAAAALLLAGKLFKTKMKADLA